MKWIEGFWFRFMCSFVILIFLFQTIQPTTFGLTLPSGLSDFVGEKTAYAEEPGEHAQDSVEQTDAFPPVIGIGRTLSTYTIDKIDSNELTISYTVFNHQMEKVDGILLVTTLEPGVAFKTSSPLPDRKGQELVWSLGSLSSFGSINVTLIVNVDNPIPLQLDNGARAFGNLSSRAVDVSASPITLREGSIDEELLKSTPDANTTDPFVLAKAAELGNDPIRILNLCAMRLAMNRIKVLSEVQEEHSGAVQEMPWIRPVC